MRDRLSPNFRRRLAAAEGIFNMLGPNGSFPVRETAAMVRLDRPSTALAEPKPAAKPKLDPEVAAAKRERLELEARIAKAEETAGANREISALRQQTAEKQAAVDRLQAEVDRRAEGGMQSKVRVGQFASGGFKCKFGRKSDRPKQTKRPGRGLAATIAKSFSK